MSQSTTWPIKLLDQATAASESSKAIDLARFDNASAQIIWDGALTAAFHVETSNDNTNWFREAVTISGAQGYAANEMVQLGNLGSRYVRITSVVTTPAGSVEIVAMGKR